MLSPERRRLLSPLLLLLVLGLGSPGCGARSDVEIERSGAGGATSSSASAGAGGTTSSSAGDGGIGPGGTSGTGGIGGAVSFECDPYQIAVAGGLDGQTIALTSDFFHAFSSSSPETAYIASYGDRSFLRVTAPFESGTFPTKEVMLSLPPEAPLPGVWLCDPKNEAVTINLKDGGISLSLAVGLNDVRLLGACPGTPVADELEFCDLSIDFCGAVLFGQLAGQPFAPALDVEVTGPTDEEQIAGFVGGGMIAVEHPPSAVAGTGVFITPSNGPDPGAVYCIGKVSPGSDGAHWKLSNLSRLGSCAEGKPADGNLAVCIAW